MQERKRMGGDGWMKKEGRKEKEGGEGIGR